MLLFHLLSLFVDASELGSQFGCFVLELFELTVGLCLAGCIAGLLEPVDDAAVDFVLLGFIAFLVDLMDLHAEEGKTTEVHKEGNYDDQPERDRDEDLLATVVTISVVTFAVVIFMVTVISTVMAVFSVTTMSAFKVSTSMVVTLILIISHVVEGLGLF